MHMLIYLSDAKGERDVKNKNADDVRTCQGWVIIRICPQKKPHIAPISVCPTPQDN